MQRVDFIPPVSNGLELRDKLRAITAMGDKIVQVITHFGFIVISESE